MVVTGTGTATPEPPHRRRSSPWPRKQDCLDGRVASGRSVTDARCVSTDPRGACRTPDPWPRKGALCPAILHTRPFPGASDASSCFFL